MCYVICSRGYGSENQTVVTYYVTKWVSGAVECFLYSGGYLILLMVKPIAHPSHAGHCTVSGRRLGLIGFRGDDPHAPRVAVGSRFRQVHRQRLHR